MTLTNETVFMAASRALIGRKVVRMFFWSETKGEITGLEFNTHSIVGPTAWAIIAFEAGGDLPAHEEKVQLQTIQQCKPGSHGIYLI
ncbi:hypothetical protein LJC49_00590 [Ruminococcaceae bacterium OttesenSCG-928-I18]|nr:hypothetical protein [Ruminococcaceae bacterium OttesenSCG-928-I18]